MNALTLPKPIRGIYYLLQDNEIVYIGQAQDVVARIITHRHQGKKNFNHYSIHAIPNGDLTVIESNEIVRHRPKYNKYLPKNSTYMNKHQLRVLLGLPTLEISRIIRNNNIKAEIICGQQFYPLAEFESWRKKA